MILDVKTLAVINLAFQLLLIVAVSGAVYLVKKRRDSRKHCTIMRVAIPLQIVATAIIMLPSMLGYIERGQRGLFFNVEMLAHHGLGLVVILLWVYINLVFTGLIKMRSTLVLAMRVTLSLWILALLLGLHMYFLIWLQT